MASWEAWGVPLIVLGIIAIIILLLFLFRRYLRGPMYDGSARMDGKTVAITGANTGIGYETALDLSKRGAKILILCRNMDKGQDAADKIKSETGGKVDLYHLDLSSLDSVRKCAAQVKDKEPRIHVLINNAGIMMTPEWKTKDGFEMQFGTNHLGHFLLTNLLLENIKAAAPSRIVTLSSMAHKLFGKMHFEDLNLTNTYGPRLAYGQSKLANMLFSKALSKRVKDYGVTTYAVHPGLVNTELSKHVEEGMNSCLSSTFIKLYGFFVKTPQLGAQTSIYCAVDEDIANETGKYYNDCREEEPSQDAQNDEDAEMLWKISSEMVNLFNYKSDHPFLNNERNNRNPSAPPGVVNNGRDISAPPGVVNNIRDPSAPAIVDVTTNRSNLVISEVPEVTD